jgi:hypothetical protein
VIDLILALSGLLDWRNVEVEEEGWQRKVLALVFSRFLAPDWCMCAVGWYHGGLGMEGQPLAEVESCTEEGEILCLAEVRNRGRVGIVGIAAEADGVGRKRGQFRRRVRRKRCGLEKASLLIVVQIGR